MKVSSIFELISSRKKSETFITPEQYFSISFIPSIELKATSLLMYETHIYCINKPKESGIS